VIKYAPYIYAFCKTPGLNHFDRAPGWSVSAAQSANLKRTCRQASLAIVVKLSLPLTAVPGAELRTALLADTREHALPVDATAGRGAGHGDSREGIDQ
jgi:hypothetical protein